MPKSTRQQLKPVAPYLYRHEATREYWGIRRANKILHCKKLQKNDGEPTTDRTNHNAAPKPFVWTATASDILEKVTRGRRTLHTTHSV